MIRIGRTVEIQSDIENICMGKHLYSHWFTQFTLIFFIFSFSYLKVNEKIGCLPVNETDKRKNSKNAQKQR